MSNLDSTDPEIRVQTFIVRFFDNRKIFKGPSYEIKTSHLLNKFEKSGMSKLNISDTTLFDEMSNIDSRSNKKYLNVSIIKDIKGNYSLNTSGATTWVSLRGKSFLNRLMKHKNNNEKETRNVTNNNYFGDDLSNNNGLINANGTSIENNNGNMFLNTHLENSFNKCIDQLRHKDMNNRQLQELSDELSKIYKGNEKSKHPLRRFKAFINNSSVWTLLQHILLIMNIKKLF